MMVRMPGAGHGASTATSSIRGPFPSACYISRTDGIETRIYQLQARHKTFAQPLNVVVIVKTNLKTQAQAHVTPL